MSDDEMVTVIMPREQAERLGLKILYGRNAIVKVPKVPLDAPTVAAPDAGRFYGPGEDKARIDSVARAQAIEEGRPWDRGPVSEEVRSAYRQQAKTFLAQLDAAREFPIRRPRP